MSPLVGAHLHTVCPLRNFDEKNAEPAQRDDVIFPSTNIFNAKVKYY